MDNSACSRARGKHEQNTRNLFEDCAWLYAFCREHLFRDHTEQIVRALFPNGIPSEPTSVLEVGCGPGFYSRKVARRFPSLHVVGIDKSSRLISFAREKASADRVTNCCFLEGDVEYLSAYVDPVDALISSRLFLVVANRATVMTELFRALKPGGRLFLAEPTANFKTRLPLSAMRFVDRLTPSLRRQAAALDTEILGSQDFKDLIHSQPWRSASIRMYGDYQCAICEKSLEETTTDDSSMGLQCDGLTTISRSLA
jgi:arsenite methyltransferase